MLGAILGLAGTAASGLMSYFNNKKAERAANSEAARQQAYYQAKANENPLARSENQHLLGQYDRTSQQQIENARGVAAITGATPEYGLAVQKAVANSRADLMGNMAAGASERADKFNQKAEEARHQKALDDQARTAARNETFAALASNAANAVGSLTDSYIGAKAAPAAPADNASPAKVATGNAIKTNGVTLQNADGTAPIYVSQEGEVSSPNDWKKRTAQAVQTPKLSANPYGANATGFIPNADGFTYKGKDGMQYIKNPDGSYKLYFPKK